MEDGRRRALRQRIAQRPASVRFSEIERLLRLSGWFVHRIRGSHYVFARGDEMLSVPFRRPHVLPVYVREVLNRTREANDDV